jgi:hypothetical protein
MPYFRWKSESDWVVREETYRYVYNIYPYNGQTSFSVWRCGGEIPIFDFPSQLIDSIGYSPDSCQASYVLNVALAWNAYVDSSIDLMPFALTNAAGTVDFDLDDSLFFPEFRDPTFGNVFPGMTSAKWKELYFEVSSDTSNFL